MRVLLFGFFVFLASSRSFATGVQAVGQQNAVWAGSLFLRGYDPTSHEKLDDKKLKALSDRLRANKIKYVYLFAGPFQNDGRLPSYPFSETARKSVLLLKKSNPALKVLPWIGGIQDKTVHVSKPRWRETSVREAAKLLATVPFDGVHLDLEYVIFPKTGASNLNLGRYDHDWLQFHQEMREGLPKTFISTTVVSSALATQPWKHKHTVGDLIAVSKYINQLSFMFYDTHLNRVESYREAIGQQLEQIKKMKSELGGKAPEYIFGVGTFKSTESLKSYRDMGVENLRFTLTSLKDQITKVPFSGNLVDGLAVYADWTTHAEDWNEIRKLWIEK